MSDHFREFEIDQWKVLALDMGNGNLIACLSSHKHRKIIAPLFAFTPKLATTISEGLFPRHEFFQFMGRVASLWKRLSSLFHCYTNRAFLSVVPSKFMRQARCSHLAVAFKRNEILKIRVTALTMIRMVF
jgi:hypothetical protein